MLRTADGRFAIVNFTSYASSSTTFNLEVDVHHSYFVHSSSIWVHNSSDFEEFIVTTYGQSTARGSGAVGDLLTGDDIPSHASNVVRIETNLGRKLTPDELRTLHSEAAVLVVTGERHKTYSGTYGGRNTPDLIAADAANPTAAIDREINNYLRDENLTPEQRRRLEAARTELKRRLCGPGG